jgi:fucose 4-O-acetylase-like acetyltransferase
MPLFFIISGMFIKEMDIKSATKKYMRTLLVPYYITSLIILFTIVTINIYFGDYDILLGYVADFGRKFFFYDENMSSVLERKIIGPLWFLVALFWGCVIVSYLKSKFKEIELGIITFGIMMATYELSKTICVPFYLSQGLMSLLFLQIGGMIHKYMILDNSVNKAVLLVMLVIGLDCALSNPSIDLARCQIGRGVYSVVGSIIISLLLLHLLIYAKITNIVFEKIGRNTLWILCGHSIVYYFLTLFSAQLYPILYISQSPYLFMVECVVQVCMAVVLGFILKKIHFYTSFAELVCHKNN